MMDVNDEQAALEKADQDIVTARERIEHQKTLIDELRRDDHDTSRAEHLLYVLQESLTAMLGYRASIVEQIERLKRK